MSKWLCAIWFVGASLWVASAAANAAVGQPWALQSVVALLYAAAGLSLYMAGRSE